VLRVLPVVALCSDAIGNEGVDVMLRYAALCCVMLRVVRKGLRGVSAVVFNEYARVLYVHIG